MLWIQAAAWSAFDIGGLVGLWIVFPDHRSLSIVVLGIVALLVLLSVYLWFLPWRVELTADEFRWHTVFRTRTVPLSRVQSIRRSGRKYAVYVKIDGRRWDLWIEARPGRLGTLADDMKAAAPHVTVTLPI
jgi:hypothetical protein